MSLQVWLASDGSFWARVALAAVLGYLLGAVPVGYLVGKAYGVDVLKHESGRTGGTNVWRATRQALPPLLTVLGDVLKGVGAVLIGRYLFNAELAAAVAGGAAVLGHNWSVLLGWRGGAGGVTAGAALLALCPPAAAIVLPVSLIGLYITHFASVGTMTAAVGGAVVLAVLAVVAPAAHPPAHVVFGLLSAAAVMVALRPNLKRLVKGTERRITLW